MKNVSLPSDLLYFSLAHKDSISESGPRINEHPTFPNVKTLFIDTCDPNFNNFLVSDFTFPRVEEIFLHTHYPWILFSNLISTITG